MKHKTIALMADPHSYKTKTALSINFAASGWNIIDLGVNSPSDEYDSFDLARQAARTFQENRCFCCIALSLTGNSLQIYANKYDVIVAAPILRFEDVEEALRLKANMCDITSRLPLAKIIAIAEAFIDGLMKERLQ